MPHVLFVGNLHQSKIPYSLINSICIYRYAIYPTNKTKDSAIVKNAKKISKNAEKKADKEDVKADMVAEIQK